uniref:Putative secreted protein n=1 Tax=Anopheles marajoara TaxID=58244 RepID=A0A2M4CCG7_9DIPT
MLQFAHMQQTACFSQRALFILQLLLQFQLFHVLAVQARQFRSIVQRMGKEALLELINHIHDSLEILLFDVHILDRIQ